MTQNETKFERKIRKDKQIALRVSTVSIIVNIVLSLVKLIAGVIANSQAMLSDSIHSASDVFSTIIVIIGVNMSSKESDEKHQYGHERFECVASILLATVLFCTGIGIGVGGIREIVAGNYSVMKIPGVFALVAAVFSVLVKEWMYWYTRSAAKMINSGALMADAWHHRSDSLSSIGAFVGILGSRMKWPVLDAVASVVICIFILKASYDIFKDAIDKMIDKSCDAKVIEELKAVALEQEGVLGIDLIRTRLFGSKIYVDIEILADGEKTLNETHETAENVHHAIEKEFDIVKHCMVHVNPVNDKRN